MAAVTARQIQKGDTVVIRYEGPRGGPGMREMLASPLRLWVRDWDMTCVCSRTDDSAVQREA